MEKSLQEESLSIVKKFLAALEQRDIAAVAALFNDKTQVKIPLSPTGDPTPWYLFDSKEKVTEYFKGACALFSQIKWKEPVFTVSADGKRIFLETHGNLIKADGNAPYENVYVFRFDIEDRSIVSIFEYANPITFSKLMNLPIG
jgi:ketosteroid isomerase-like protein